MRTLAFVVATVVIIPAAVAEPSERAMYVAGGMEAGVHVLLETSAVVQGGVQVSGPWQVRALVGVGADDALHVGPTPQGYRQYRLGLERERCTAGDRWCGFAGVDVGYHLVTETDVMDVIEHRGVDVIGRAGFDVGAGHTYLRATIDLRGGYDRRTSTMEAPSSYTGWTGLAVGLAFLVR